MRLRKLEDIIKVILTEDFKAREDDMYLYYVYLMKMGVNMYKIHEILANKEARKRIGLSNIESVGRCRRKLQEKNESLKASSAVEQIRKSEEERFKKYARN